MRRQRVLSHPSLEVNQLTTTDVIMLKASSPAIVNPCCTIGARPSMDGIGEVCARGCRSHERGSAGRLDGSCCSLGLLRRAQYTMLRTRDVLPEFEFTTLIALSEHHGLEASATAALVRIAQLLVIESHSRQTQPLCCGSCCSLLLPACWLEGDSSSTIASYLEQQSPEST